MFIEIQKKNLKTFAYLLFVGNYVANANREQEEKLSDFEELTDELLATLFPELKEEKDEDYSLDDLYEELFQETAWLIESYEMDSIPQTLAKLFADRDFPFYNYNSREADLHFEKEAVLEEEFEKNGIENLKILYVL